LKLLKGELYRRIKEFDKASQVFLELKDKVNDKSIYHQIISQQLELIANKNPFSAPIAQAIQ